MIVMMLLRLKLILQTNYDRKYRIPGEERSDEFTDFTFSTLLVASLRVHRFYVLYFTHRFAPHGNSLRSSISYSQLVASFLAAPHLLSVLDRVTYAH